MDETGTLGFARHAAAAPGAPDALPADDPLLRDMARLERLCFPRPFNYPLGTLRRFLAQPGAALLTWRAEPDADVPPAALPDGTGAPGALVAFHVFDFDDRELITLDVHPDWRRRGLGTRLVGESLARLAAAGCRRARCHIAVGNDASVDLHAKLGFRVIRRVRAYYGPARAAWLMEAPTRPASIK